METVQEIYEELRKNNYITQDFPIWTPESLSDYSTKDLVEELKSREGVNFRVIGVENSVSVSTSFNSKDEDSYSGPVIVLIVRD